MGAFMTTAGADEGIGILELLVGLAITSLLVVAVGWFLSMAVGLRNLTDRSSDIDRALLRLTGLEANLTHAPGKVVRDGSNLKIDYEAVGHGKYSAKLQFRELADAGTRSIVAVGDTLPEASVDLSSFDIVSLQVFSGDAGSMTWKPLSAIGASDQIEGVRLQLGAMSRSWYPILWTSAKVMGAEP